MCENTGAPGTADGPVSMTGPRGLDRPLDPSDGIPWDQLTPRQNLERRACLARSAMRSARDPAMAAFQEKILRDLLDDLDRLGEGAP